MSKRKKKNAITLISLLVALAALIGFYYWYSNKDKNNEGTKGKEGVTEDNEALSLAVMDKDLIASLHISNKNIDIKLSLENEVWKSVEEPNRPINQDVVNELLNMVSVVKAKKIIHENPEDLGQFGLAEPSFYLKLVQTDQKTLTLNLGDAAIGGEGYYALVDDRKEVYLLASTYGIGIPYVDTDITAIEGEPNIDSGNIYHIEVTKKDGDNFELRYDKENNSDNSQRGMYPWVILQPYEEGYSADATKVTELLPNYSAFDFVATVDYIGEDLRQYGLEDPAASILVDYYETYTEELDEPEIDPSTGDEITEKTHAVEKSIKAYIGDEDGNGNYYVRMDGNNTVYTMKVETTDKMLDVDAFGLMVSFVNIPYIDTVNRIDVTIEGKLYPMDIERKTIKNNEGEDEVQATYYYKGDVVEENVFKDVYQALIRASYDAKITGEVNTKDIEPYMTITYYIGDDIRLTSSYLPYNDSFYMIDNGKSIRFFADKRKIDEIAQTVIDFKSIEE